MRAQEFVVENADQAAVDALLKKHGWSMGRTVNGDLAFTWQGRSYVFYGERMRINLPNGQSVSVVWGQKPTWQGRPGEISFAQAVQQKYLTFDLPIWQALDRGQITDSQAMQQFKAENERQAREAIAQGVTEGVRVPAQQILGTKNRAQSAYYPTNVKPKVKKLDKPLTDKELTKLSNNNKMSEGDVVPFKRPSQTLTWQQVPKNILLLANDWFWASEDNSGLDATIDPKGYGNGTANDVQYNAAKLQQQGWSIDFNDEYDEPGEFNLRLTNRRGQTVLLPIEDAQDFTGWAAGTSSYQPVSEGPIVPRIIHPGRVTIYVRAGANRPPAMIATDVPYEILDRYIKKVIEKYPQFKSTDFSFKSSDKIANENIKVEPIARPVPIQPTQTQPKQHTHIPPEKKTPAAIIHIGQKNSHKKPN